MAGEDICIIRNKHVDSCGEPPEIDIDEFSYVSYFENSHGEQSIFLYDSDEDEVVVYIADAGWENPQRIPGEWVLKNKALPEGVDVEIYPDSDEEAWLRACKSAVETMIR